MGRTAIVESRETPSLLPHSAETIPFVVRIQRDCLWVSSMFLRWNAVPNGGAWNGTGGGAPIYGSGSSTRVAHHSGEFGAPVFRDSRPVWHIIRRNSMLLHDNEFYVVEGD